MKNKIFRKGNNGVFVVLLFILSLLLEIFVFNFKWIQSRTSTPLDVKYRNEEGRLIFDDLDEELQYLYFYPGDQAQVTVYIGASDEANANGIGTPERVIRSDVPRSQYIRLHFSGKVKSLWIGIGGDLGEGAEVVLNAKVPLMFSWKRMLIVFGSLLLLYLLRPGSALYKIRTNLKNPKQLLVVVLCVAIQASALWGMIHWNSQTLYWHMNYEHHRQYYSLIDNMKKGHLYIEDENIPQELLDMENPYDKGERDRLGAYSKWDHAFFQGKYYVYFGVVPLILFYLPYNLITGADLPNYMLLYLESIAFMAGILYLLWQIIKRWYQNTPFVLYLLTSVVYGAVSGIGYVIYKPDFYLVPSMTALMLGIWGLGLWISAEYKPEQSGGQSRLIPWRLALGSLLVALIAGCRPQMILVAFLGVMFFWNLAFKEKLLFYKKSIKETLAVCLPFVIVALFLMWYNYARFGSPFDFGANYNLTTNDMTHRGWVWGRAGLGIFSYLFQPINMDAVFPFLNDFSAATTYQGLTLTEKMVGGVYILFPILAIGLYGTFHGKLFLDKRAYRMVYMSSIMVIIIAVVDAQMAGLLTRYFSDFVWFAMLASVLTIFALYQGMGKEAKGHLISLVVTLSCISMIFVFLRIFAHTEDAIQYSNPKLYYDIQHLVAFWM